MQQTQSPSSNFQYENYTIVFVEVLYEQNFMNTPHTFPIMKENMLLFVVLKHIKLSNLIKQKASNKEQSSQSRMSDQH